MIPLWIIDFGEDKDSSAKLRSLLDALSAAQKPYWKYTHVECKPVANATDYRTLVKELVEEGRKCYNKFIQEGYNINNFQIAVLGTANEELSQSIFAPIAGLLRDNLPRIVSDHANLGVEITGILFIPRTINQTDDVQKRQKAAMLLEAINMLSEQVGTRHYNRVIAYQDVQYQNARFYPGLSTEERTEFQFQLLSHLFLGSSHTEKIFDKVGTEGGIFSLGVASIYYNSTQHRSHQLKLLLNKLLEQFKDKDNADAAYSQKCIHEMFDKDSANPEAITTRLREGCCSLDIDLRKMEGEADPHPVWDLFQANLLSTYYRKYLKYMPARLVRFMQSLSYILLSKYSEIIRNNRKAAVEKFRVLLQSIYNKSLTDTSNRFATIAQLESFFQEAKEYLKKLKATREAQQLEIVPVPDYLRMDYDKCLADEDANKPSAILDNLKKNLRREPIVLSLIVRCFLLGILLVFTLIPLIRMLTPNIVNLGDISKYEWLWIFLLFFLPLIVEFGFKLRRHFKRVKRLKYRLLASTLVSVNKRLSQFLVEELKQFYEEMTQECDTQLEKLATFRQLIATPEADTGDIILPETKFNQPLVGGSFQDQKLILDNTAAEAEVRIMDTPRRLSTLDKEELLTLLQSSFKNLDVLSAACLPGSENLAENAESFVDAIKLHFNPQLHIHTADSIGAMLTLLGTKVDLLPLVHMAGINGMLFSTASNNPPVVKITNTPRAFAGMTTISDNATSDYAMITTWQKLSPGIYSQIVCNCSLDPLPPLTFADKLALYYGYYKRKNLAYTLAESPIRISKDEMDTLDELINME